MPSTIKKIDTKTMPTTNGNINSNTSVGNSVTSVVSEIVDVVDHKLLSIEPLAKIAANDGYTVTNYTAAGNNNVVFAVKDGESSVLYLTDGDNNLVGRIVMDSNEEIVNSVYDEKTNMITAETKSGKKFEYNLDRVKASIKIAGKYEGSNTGNYYATDGEKYVEVASAELGKDYVWGAVGPDSYDCSGFVGYVVTGRHERIGTTYTFMEWPQVSDPMPGDICVNSNHTGIYIGDGQMIHAATEGVGVITGPVQDGMIYVRYDGRCD